MYFAVLEEIYNNVCCSSLLVSVLISRNHLITRLISFTKNASEINSFWVHIQKELGPYTETIDLRFDA
jgi:hypothetical protein